MPIDETFNPTIHRLSHAVKHRAIHPDKPVPDTPKALLKFSSPVESLVEKVKDQIEALIEASEVKKGWLWHNYVVDLKLMTYSTTKSERKTRARSSQAHLWPGC